MIGSNVASAVDGTSTLTQIILRHRISLSCIPVIAGIASFIFATLFISPTYTATTTFMPPAGQQNAAASVLASLGAIGGLAGTVASVQTPADRYVSLMQSVTVSNRIIDHFKLIDTYGKKYLEDARKELKSNVQLEVGKKDGLITVSVDDQVPQRAADIANQYVEELRNLTAGLAMSEAQQRRKFFEARLGETRKNLASAQRDLGGSGFGQESLRSEPRMAAENYARQRAELAAAEMNLARLRQSLADNSAEVRDATTRIAALRNEVRKSEEPLRNSGSANYAEKYREYKYQEALLEIFSKQYEAARIDESREGNLIQVIDPATVPERKSKPRRSLIALGTASVTFFAMLMAFVVAATRRESHS